MERQQVNKRIRIYLKELSWFALGTMIAILVSIVLQAAAFNFDIQFATGIILWLFCFIRLQFRLDKKLIPKEVFSYGRLIRVGAVIIVLVMLLLVEVYIRDVRRDSCIGYDPDDNPFHYFLSLTWKTIVLWEVAVHITLRTRTAAIS